LLYAITDRRMVADNQPKALERLVELSRLWAANGVAFIQIRENDLAGRDLVELARAVIRACRLVSGTTRVMLNGRVDVALAAEADGVHLPSGPDALTPDQVRMIFKAAGNTRAPIISVSCHTLEEVNAVREQSPDCILFAPVFEKMIREKDGTSDAALSRENNKKLPGSGLALLEQACKLAAPLPVYALGGVTVDNATDCLRAGAGGVAAIRLLLEPVSTWKHLA
jgi:thiamine-phosphate pyrophosphorylase